LEEGDDKELSFVLHPHNEVPPKILEAPSTEEEHITRLPYSDVGYVNGAAQGVFSSFSMLPSRLIECY
jgi:hypothetical protein